MAGAAHEGAQAAPEVQAPWPPANALPADKKELEIVNNEKRMDLGMDLTFQLKHPPQRSLRSADEKRCTE